MARMNASESAPTSTLLPAGDHLCHIVGVSREATADSWFLRLTLLTAAGNAGRIDVRGVYDNGKGPWVARVSAAVAMAVRNSLPPVDGNVQPFMDYDWESEADLRAIMLGGACYLTIEVEKGSEKPDGTSYPDKNSARWLNAAAAADDEVRKLRAADAWKTYAPGIRSQREAAIAEWRAGLERAANGGSATDQVDDAIPF
jgi:hypothetical protein